MPGRGPRQRCSRRSRSWPWMWTAACKGKPSSSAHKGRGRKGAPFVRCVPSRPTRAPSPEPWATRPALTNGQPRVGEPEAGSSSRRPSTARAKHKRRVASSVPPRPRSARVRATAASAWKPPSSSTSRRAAASSSTASGPSASPPRGSKPARATVADRVRRQDALDRERNHFMKDFRGTHGFDRPACTPEQEAAWRAGLDRVNAEVDEGRPAPAPIAYDARGSRSGHPAGVAELVDAQDLGSCAARRRGSSPLSRTTPKTAVSRVLRLILANGLRHVASLGVTTSQDLGGPQGGPSLRS